MVAHNIVECETNQKFMSFFNASLANKYCERVLEKNSNGRPVGKNF